LEEFEPSQMGMSVLSRDGRGRNRGLTRRFVGVGWTRVISALQVPIRGRTMMKGELKGFLRRSRGA